MESMTVRSAMSLAQHSQVRTWSTPRSNPHRPQSGAPCQSVRFSVCSKASFLRHLRTPSIASPFALRPSHCGAQLCCSQSSHFLGSPWLLRPALALRQRPVRHASRTVRSSKGPLSVPKPRLPIEVTNIITVLTTVFLVTNEQLFQSAGLTGRELHRTVISTQAVGLFLILGLTLQSYLDLRALREVTSAATLERPSEPSEAQAEVVDRSDLLKELGRSQPSKDELKIFVTSGEGKKTKTLRLEEWVLDGIRDYEALLDTVRKIVPQLTAYPLTVLYQVRQSGEFFLLEAEDDVPRVLGTAGFVYIHPTPSWE